MANILHGHFNEDQICPLTTGVSYCVHKASDALATAFYFFQSYYPHISNQADIYFMNNNAPKEA